MSYETADLGRGYKHLGWAVGLHALAGLPDAAGLVPMDPAEVPNQLECADAPRATTSQLFKGPEDGAPRELTLKAAAAFLASF